MPEGLPGFNSESVTNQRLSQIEKTRDKLNNLISSLASGYHYFLPTAAQTTKFFAESSPDSAGFHKMNDRRQKLAEIGVDISRQMEVYDLTQEEVNSYEGIISAAKSSGEVNDEELDAVEATEKKMIEIYQALKKMGYEDSDLGVAETSE